MTSEEHTDKVSALLERADEMHRRLSVAAPQVVQQREFFLDAAQVIADLKTDLERVSAEREAYREARSFCSWLVSMDEPGSSARRTVTLTKIIDEARRILAEKERNR